MRAVKALRAVHGRFYQDALPIGVGLIGPGLIGGTLLRQLQEQVGRGAARWRGGAVPLLPLPSTCTLAAARAFACPHGC